METSQWEKRTKASGKKKHVINRKEERNWVLDYQPLFEPTDKAKYFVL